MDVIESSWFLVSSLIIGIVLLVDPKSSLTGSNTNAVLGLFSSPSSGQQFIYNFSAILILSFFLLTIVLSLNN
jgi:protein translocase SecG subunit|tara:strand:+ start:412 stop:630 length:219 start_codon:yes stop_codon:yes gene_type:complete